MDTIENNKLIAEFMGYELSVTGTMVLPDVPYGVNLNRFEESWDYLMLVVEKIESFVYEHGCAKYNVRIEQSWVDIIDNHTSDEIVKVDGYNRREATYKAVVEFINEYNKKKED